MKTIKNILFYTLAIIIVLSILSIVWYLCSLLMYAIPFEYLQPTATGMLFVFVLEAYGNWRKESKQIKDENN